jgi:nucleotide-binding universal stress UspA family protein
VPLDAIEETAAALKETIELAGDAAAEVVVLHALHGASLPLFSDQPQHEPEAWGQEFLARYSPQPERVRLETRVGVPAELVPTVAKETEADLIALAWSQNMAPGRARVVRAVLERSDVPVLLVPV